LATVSTPKDILTDALLSILQTRQGERVMMPDYGLPDSIFSVKGAGFVRLLGFYLKQQVERYVPGIASVEVAEQPGAGEHESILLVTWTERGTNVPHNLVYPTRQLVGG
jgi:phage baseplate assembly protein W